MAQLGVGDTALSAHVFHPDWTICQHKSCSKKKMNCMYSSNSRHLILACLAAIQLVVPTEIDIGAHHFQKSLRVFACWLQSARQHGGWTRPSPYAVRSWMSSAKCNLLTCTSAPHRAPPQHCSRLRSAGTQQLPQPFLGLSMWDVLSEHGRVPVHTVCSCAWAWLNLWTSETWPYTDTEKNSQRFYCLYTWDKNVYLACRQGYLPSLHSSTILLYPLL